MLKRRHPQNRTIRRNVRRHLRYGNRRRPAPDPDAEDVLYDPQTSGGLLLSVPAAEADAIVEACRAAGAAQACVIGSVEEMQRLLGGRS